MPSWDAENRLAEMVSDTTKVECKYDYRSRRVGKRVSTSADNGTTWTLSSVRRFLYDGWTPIAELDATAGISLDRTHLWGTDLSGTLAGAGGIGGLLRTRVYSPTGSADYYPTYDANGNVSEYVDSSGAVVAHYEHAPFGGVTAATGTMAASFAFRYSTKYLDTETALWYYGYRYYDPQTGRWMSRDPLGEMGGANLLAFVVNAPLFLLDPLGLDGTGFWAQTWGFTTEFARAVRGKSDIEVPDSSLSATEQFALPAAAGGLQATLDVAEVAGGLAEAYVGGTYSLRGGPLASAGGAAMLTDGASRAAGGVGRWWDLVSGGEGSNWDTVRNLTRWGATRRGLHPAWGDLARDTASMAATAIACNAIAARQAAALRNAAKSATSCPAKTAPGSAVRFEGLTEAQVQQVKTAMREAGIPADADLLIKGADMPPGYSGMTLGDEGFAVNRAILDNSDELIKTFRHELKHVLDRKTLGNAGAYGSALEDAARAAE